MKISQYLMTSVARLVKPHAPQNLKANFILDVVDELRHRYRFLQIPTKIEDFRFDQGIDFINGVFNEDKIISKLKIYNNGFYCEAELPTEVICEFIDDIFELLRKNYNLNIEDTEEPSQFFTSGVEVQSTIDFARSIDSRSELGQLIAERLSYYGHEVPIFKPTFLGLHYEESRDDSIRPSMFTFERRAGHSFDSGLFYSSAPLKSADHLLVLDRLESVFSD